MSLAVSMYDKPAVIEVIPIWATVDQLSKRGFYGVGERWTRSADKIADVVTRLKYDPGAPLIKTEDLDGEPVVRPSKHVLRQVIFDVMKRVFTDDSPLIEPTNPFLVSAFISGHVSAVVYAIRVDSRTSNAGKWLQKRMQRFGRYTRHSIYWREERESITRSKWDIVETSFCRRLKLSSSRISSLILKGENFCRYFRLLYNHCFTSNWRLLCRQP